MTPYATSSAAFAATQWSTASFGQTADTSPGELSALGEHLHSCRGARGHLFAMHCMADSVHGFVAARFVTTLAAAALLLAVAAWLF